MPPPTTTSWGKKELNQTHRRTRTYSGEKERKRRSPAARPKIDHIITLRPEAGRQDSSAAAMETAAASGKENPNGRVYVELAYKKSELIQSDADRPMMARLSFLLRLRDLPRGQNNWFFVSVLNLRWPVQWQWRLFPTEMTVGTNDCCEHASELVS